MPLIQYIGRRQNHTDTIYSTGDWVVGQVKDVPVTVAAKMLKHGDVYAAGYVQEHPVEVGSGQSLFSMAAWPECSTIVVEEKESATCDDDEQNQMARDAVAAMSSKDAIADYARINFNQMIPKTLSLENMKQRAVTLIDQYGAQ